MNIVYVLETEESIQGRLDDELSIMKSMVFAVADEQFRVVSRDLLNFITVSVTGRSQSLIDTFIRSAFSPYAAAFERQGGAS